MLVQTLEIQTDRVVCHCLQVRESQVRCCVAELGLDTVPDVKSHCGAGGGCTACHRRIRDLINEHRRSLLAAEWAAD